MMQDMIKKAIESYMDAAKFKARKEQQEHERKSLKDVSGYWSDVTEFVEERVQEDTEEDD